MSFTRVCPLNELGEAEPWATTVDDVPVAVVRLGEEVFAIHDECSHAAIPLSEGDVEAADGRCLIECWLHGSSFDLRTGLPTTLPAFEPVPVYPVRIDGDDVLVDVTTPVSQRESA